MTPSAMTGWCSGLSSTGTASPCCPEMPKRRTCGPAAKRRGPVGGRAPSCLTTVPRQPCPGPVRQRCPQSWPSPAPERTTRTGFPPGKSATPLEWRDIPLHITGNEGEIAVHWDLKKNAGKKNILQEGFPPPRPHLSQYVQPMGRAREGSPPETRNETASSHYSQKTVGGGERVQGRQKCILQKAPSRFGPPIIRISSATDGNA